MALKTETPVLSSKNQKELIILYHALLIGASPLIPVPFVDEKIMVSFWRHMVLHLSKSHGIQLSDAQVRALAYQQQSCCESGCATAIIYPLKELFREILFFWNGNGL